MEILVPYDYKKELLTLLNSYPVSLHTSQTNSTAPVYHYSLQTEAFKVNLATVGGNTTLYLNPPEKHTHATALHLLKELKSTADTLNISENKKLWFVLLNFFAIDFTSLPGGQFYTDQNPPQYSESDIIKAVNDADTFIQAVLILETGLPKSTIEVMPMEWITPIVHKD